MKQEKKQPGKLKMLAGYYKPYRGLFFADLFFAFLGAAVTLVIPLMVRYIMNSVSELSAVEAKTIILKIGVGMLLLILVQTIPSVSDFIFSENKVELFYNI